MSRPSSSESHFQKWRFCTGETLSRSHAKESLGRGGVSSEEFQPKLSFALSGTLSARRDTHKESSDHVQRSKKRAPFRSVSFCVLLELFASPYGEWRTLTRIAVAIHIISLRILIWIAKKNLAFKKHLITKLRF